MTARYAHAMPFGSEVMQDGSVRFRLWAPDRSRVALALKNRGAERILELVPSGEGWFECTTDEARPGTRYAFVLEDGKRVPDPASRFQPNDVHGPSLVVDPKAYAWQHGAWRGRPWAESVIYELHLGCFTGSGGYSGVLRRLDHLADLGVTAVELMPIADFEGRRNWGYDGVLPFAPDASYGRPNGLKRLIDEAHGRGLMVFLDVVYNHFGPSGNYLHLYAESFFTDRYHTPWGKAIDFAGPRSRIVREFFIHNALYWLQEYRFDGLRLDAVHAIFDESAPDILDELAARVHATVEPGRHVHLILENDANDARYLTRGETGEPRSYVAQWNDDFHHAAHVVATGEDTGYYQDYVDGPVARFGRALAEGFVYQGEPSPFRDGQLRGSSSAHLPPTAFVDFLQNHDQVGNRAFGTRLTALAPERVVRALSAILLLSPHVPLIFMGEEWGSRRPFYFFCDFEGELANAVREGRRREFARFAEFRDPEARERIPDPNAVETYRASKLDWRGMASARGRRWLDYTRCLLTLRRREIAPRLAGAPGGRAQASASENGDLRVSWTLGDGSRLHLLANLSFEPADAPRSEVRGRTLLAEPEPEGKPPLRLGPWSVLWLLDDGSAPVRESDR
ncbi:MAG TPA: malto-oligosyltrehalose trehalohydrolase [Kiloniellales bacterium]|nr:malto-oligosyltrehalose trehalohydrolase [Kiloniellales bacterium]